MNQHRKAHWHFQSACLAVALLTSACVARGGDLPSSAPQTAHRAYVEEAIGQRFVFIPPGTFQMGSRFAETAPEVERRFFADEAPIHTVQLSRGLWLATTEVTVGQFRKFVAETGYVTSAERRGESLGEYAVAPAQGTQKASGGFVSGKRLTWANPGIASSDQHPVTHVSWEDAAAFCAWLRDKTGRNYRLPTEAEWEFSAGGPRHTLYSWGDHVPTGLQGGNIADARFSAMYRDWKYPVLSTYDDGHAGPAPVARYLTNGFGVHDMSGNVWEWTGDFYAADFYAQSPQVDPVGPATAPVDPSAPEGRPKRVHRGGGFDWELPYLRNAKRRGATEDASALHLGFRLAASP